MNLSSVVWLGESLFLAQVRFVRFSIILVGISRPLLVCGGRLATAKCAPIVHIKGHHPSIYTVQRGSANIPANHLLSSYRPLKLYLLPRFVRFYYCSVTLACSASCAYAENQSRLSSPRWREGSHSHRVVRCFASY
jgi:hypothetical protein